MNHPNTPTSRQPISAEADLSGINPDELTHQSTIGGQQSALGEHSVPGQAGEPGEGNSSAARSYSGNPGANTTTQENPANREVSPDQLRARRENELNKNKSWNRDNIDSISK